MSYDYESTLQLFLLLNSYETFDFESEFTDLPLIKGISWRLQGTKGYYGDYSRLVAVVHGGDEELTEDLSCAIRIDVKPTVFSLTSEFFALDTYTEKDISEDFQMAGIGNYNFQEVLETNGFVLQIKATLTIRSSRDLIAPTVAPTLAPSLAPTKFFKDISNPDLADFTIQIGSDTWSAHKFILSARSPVFRCMLANKECEESKQSLLKLVDVTKDTFEIFFRYLYTERVPNLSLEQATDVLIVADKYDVQELKNLCDKTLVKLLQEADPVHDIFQCAHAYNCSQELKQKAFGFIKSSIIKRQNQNLCDELVEMPEQVKMLVEMMAKMAEKKKEFDETVKKMNEAAEVAKK